MSNQIDRSDLIRPKDRSAALPQFHQPVLVNEVIAFLQVKSSGLYIDATLGGGGHAHQILNLGGQVLGLDYDPETIAYNKNNLKQFKNKLTLVQGNFARIEAIAEKHHFTPVKGIIFDLGISTYQLLQAKRGLSFLKDEPLDMRLDPSLEVTAADLINGLGRKELYVVFTQLAQEKRARPIADAIIRARRLKPITTTKQLAEIVSQVCKGKIRGKLHPATRVFLSLRILVNDEINNLKKALPQATKILKSKGRLLVISFHETEDRLVKNFFKKSAQEKQLKIINKKPITPSLQEINTNPASRSAKLRVAQKI